MPNFTVDDAGQIRGAYQQHLGREASDDEIQGWLSGSFGGGGVNDWVNQIATSHEAQQRGPAPPAWPGGGTGWSENQPVVGQNPNVSRPMELPPGLDPSFGFSIDQAYLDYLGRSASPDEISNWWSGQYGYGQGWGGLGQFREAIRTSDEARQRGGGTVPQPARMDQYYWETQGVKPEDIFDLKTGQIRPGWERFEHGYRRTGQAGVSGLPNGITDPGAPKSMSEGDVMGWFLNLVKTLPPSPQSLKQLEPLLNRYGIKLGPANARGWTDGVILPDGTFYDVIEAATETGGKGWAFFRPTPGGVGGGPLPGNQFSDAYTQLLEQLLKSRIGNLQNGYNDYARQQYETALQDRAKALATGNSQLDQLLKYLQDRFTDLKGPGYTGAENEVLRSSALDPIERDKTAARDQLRRRLSAMGHGPESGVFQQAMQMLEQEFMGMRGIAQTQLATNELNRRENRNQRAELIAGQIADIPEMRSREQLDVFRALENLSMLARQEDEARAREAISYGGVLADLAPQRMQLAMQAAGMGGNPASLGGMLTNIAGMNQNAAMYNQGQNNSLWSGLGTLAAIMARSGQSGLSGAGF